MALAHPELVTYLDLLTTRCKKHYGEELLSLVLYGSIVRGTFRPTSDLDLLVVLRSTTLSWGKRISQFLGGVLDHSDVERAQARLRQMSLPWRIEPIILTERELGARRVWLSGDRWYWVLTPEIRPGEVITI
jgi:predicted nucleotidyltransferase